MSLDDLVSAIPDRSGRTVALGEVTAASPLKVRFAGTSAADAVEGVQVVGSYAPTVGDRVVLLKVGAAWVVMGSPDATAAATDHTHPPGDAQTLDGLDSTAFARAAHGHDYAATGHTHPAGDAATLDGLDSTDFLLKGGTFGVAGGENTRAAPTGGLNQRLRSGWYDGSGMVGAPTGDWWLVHVISHSNGAHWQRQIAYSMTSEQGTASIYSRRCNGGDPTVAGNWTRWEPVGPVPSFTVGQMHRTSNHNGPASTRYVVPMQAGTGDDGRRPLYWDGGGGLRVRWDGWYEFAAHCHTHSGVTGRQSIELRRLPAGGGEHSLAEHYHGNTSGGSWSLASGPVRLGAGDTIDLVQDDPHGVSFFHRGSGAFVRGRYLGPA